MSNQNETAAARLELSKAEAAENSSGAFHAKAAPVSCSGKPGTFDDNILEHLTPEERVEFDDYIESEQDYLAESTVTYTEESFRRERNHYNWHEEHGAHGHDMREWAKEINEDERRMRSEAKMEAERIMSMSHSQLLDEQCEQIIDCAMEHFSSKGDDDDDPVGRSLAIKLLRHAPNTLANHEPRKSLVATCRDR